ncbi:MAG: zinc ribbon domain-containing protein [Bdellovibrionota bacterium]
MPLYEFLCENCKYRFEQLTSFADSDQGNCPKCNNKNIKKLISAFAVGGHETYSDNKFHGCGNCEFGGSGGERCGRSSAGFDD